MNKLLSGGHVVNELLFGDQFVKELTSRGEFVNGGMIVKRDKQ